MFDVLSAHGAVLRRGQFELAVRVVSTANRGTEVVARLYAMFSVGRDFDACLSMLDGEQLVLVGGQTDSAEDLASLQSFAMRFHPTVSVVHVEDALPNRLIVPMIACMIYRGARAAS